MFGFLTIESRQMLQQQKKKDEDEDEDLISGKRGMKKNGRDGGMR
jgi:hypothetical protein